MHARAVRILLAGFVVAAVACGGPGADARLKRGNDYVTQGRYPDAIIEFRTALSKEPKRADIRTRLADILLVTRDRLGATREYVIAADLTPKDVSAQVKAATMLLSSYNVEDAKTRVDAALALDPNDVQALILKGLVQAGLKDMDGAIADFQRALTLNGGEEADVAAYKNIATLQKVQGKPGDAEQTLKKAISTAPKSVPAHLALANLYWATDRTAEAERMFKDTLALEPDNVEANRAVGTFYLASNRLAEAEPFFKAIAKKQQTPEASLMLVDYYVAAKKIEDARKILRDVAATEKGYAGATLRLAALDYRDGGRAQALTRLAELLGKFPKDSAARLQQARYLAVDGKNSEALAAATALITDDPNGAEATAAYELIGQLQIDAHRLDDAEKAFNESLKRQANPAVTLLALGSLKLSVHDYTAATSYARQALTARPNLAGARILLAKIHLAQGDVGAAATEITGLRKDFPNSLVVAGLYGSQQLQQKQYAAARDTYARMLAVAPKNTDAIYGLAFIDMAEHKNKEALARLDKGVQDTSDPTLYTLAARAHAAVNDLPGAEELLKKAIASDPNNVDAYGLLGSLYARENRLADARDRFRQLVEKNPKSVGGHTMLGMILEAQGHKDEAEKEYLLVLVIDPQAIMANNNLAYLYLSSNRNLDQALQMAQIAQQRLPGAANVNDTLGWIYYRKNQPTRAIEFLTKAVGADAANPVYLAHLGMAYAQNGDRRQARPALEKALGMAKDFEDAAEARTVLASLKS